MTRAIGQSLDEIMLATTLDVTVPSGLNQSDRKSIYEVVSSMFQYQMVSRPHCTKPGTIIAYLKNKFSKTTAAATAGIVLLDTQHRLIGTYESIIMKPEDLVGAILKNRANAIISFDVSQDGYRLINKKIVGHVSEIAKSIDVRHLDHVQLDFQDEDFTSYAEKGWM